MYKIAERFFSSMKIKQKFLKCYQLETNYYMLQKDSNTKITIFFYLRCKSIIN